MSRACKLCGQRIKRLRDAEHYAFCGVSGVMCSACAISFASVVGTWVKGRAVLAEQRRAAEQAAADELDRELAAERLASASLEALPLSTRAAMARAARRSAA